jgi:hypothetical protein
MIAIKSVGLLGVVTREFELLLSVLFECDEPVFA